MPPASLPAFAAISPGPRIARRRKTRGNRRASGDSSERRSACCPARSPVVSILALVMTIAHLSHLAVIAA
jgi:hypothetical protein